AGDIELLPMVVADCVHGHSCPLQPFHDICVGADWATEQLHPTCVERADEFGMLWEAHGKGFERCAKWPAGIEHAVIDLQQSNFCEDRGGCRIRVAHPPVKVERVPSEQDIAD